MKYWYGFWAVFCSIATLVCTSVGVMSLFAFSTSGSSGSFDMGIMGLAAFGLCIGFAWVFLSAAISLFGISLQKQNLIKIASSMMP